MSKHESMSESVKSFKVNELLTKEQVNPDEQMYLYKQKIDPNDIPTINNNGRILAYKPKFLDIDEKLESTTNKYQFRYTNEQHFPSHEQIDEILANKASIHKFIKDHKFHNGLQSSNFNNNQSKPSTIDIFTPNELIPSKKRPDSRSGSRPNSLGSQRSRERVNSAKESTKADLEDSFNSQHKDLMSNFENIDDIKLKYKQLQERCRNMPRSEYDKLINEFNKIHYSKNNNVNSQNNTYKNKQMRNTDNSKIAFDELEFDNKIPFGKMEQNDLPRMKNKGNIKFRSSSPYKNPNSFGIGNGTTQSSNDSTRVQFNIDDSVINHISSIPDRNRLNGRNKKRDHNNASNQSKRYNKSKSPRDNDSNETPDFNDKLSNKFYSQEQPNEIIVDNSIKIKTSKRKQYSGSPSLNIKKKINQNQCQNHSIIVNNQERKIDKDSPIMKHQNILDNYKNKNHGKQFEDSKQIKNKQQNDIYNMKNVDINNLEGFNMTFSNHGSKDLGKPNMNSSKGSLNESDLKLPQIPFSKMDNSHFKEINMKDNIQVDDEFNEFASKNSNRAQSGRIINKRSRENSYDKSYLYRNSEENQPLQKMSSMNSNNSSKKNTPRMKDNKYNNNQKQQ